MLMCDFRNCFDFQQFAIRIADHFSEQQASIRAKSIADRVMITGVHKRRFYAESRQSIREQVVRAAID